MIRYYCDWCKEEVPVHAALSKFRWSLGQGNLADTTVKSEVCSICATCQTNAGIENVELEDPPELRRVLGRWLAELIAGLREKAKSFASDTEAKR